MKEIDEKRKAIKEIQKQIHSLTEEENRLHKEIKILQNNDPRQLKIPFAFDD